jgi:hypothetical protein
VLFDPVIEGKGVGGELLPAPGTDEALDPLAKTLRRIGTVPMVPGMAPRPRDDLLIMIHTVRIRAEGGDYKHRKPP